MNWFLGSSYNRTRQTPLTKNTNHKEKHSHTYFSKGLGSGAPEIEKMLKSGLHTSSGRRDLVHFEYFKAETKETHISIFEIMAETFLMNFTEQSR